MKRQVNISTLFRLLKSKRPFGILGLIFIVLSVALLLFISFLGMAFKGENGDYNFNELKKHGVQTDADVTYIKTVYNLTINGEHPVIISYEYLDKGSKVKDKFETLDLENIANISIGTKIKVLVYNNQSIIKDIEPFDFPVRFFYLLPASFFVAGIILLLIALIPAMKEYNLYRFGRLKDAVIVSVSLKNGMLHGSNLRGKPTANYYFMDQHQNKIFGESETTDILFLMGKKAGDIIKIFVSEQDESKSCLVPNLEAVKNNWDLNTA